MAYPCGVSESARHRSLTIVALAAVLITTVSVARAAAQGRTEVVVNDAREYPESVTSSRDGAVFFGSLEKGIIYRAAPGASRAEPWVQPAAAGLQTVLGVLADDASSTLWVCSSAPVAPGATPPPVRDSSLKALDLRSGALKGSYPFPGGGVCNDIAVAPDGTAYATDTMAGRVLRLRRGAQALAVWSTDKLLASADGLALLADGALYVNTVQTGTLVRIPVNRDGSAGQAAKLETSRPLVRPDGMRSVNGMILLLAEGDGRLDEVTINGDAARVNVLKEGLAGPTAVTLVGDTAFVLEAKLNYRNDPNLRSQDPGPFRAVAVPYRAPK